MFGQTELASLQRPSLLRGMVLRLGSSHLCSFVLALLSEDNAVPPLGGGARLLGNQPPRLWVKLRCRVS